jgi:hypothetical protein
MAFSHFGSEPHFTVMSYSGLDLPPPLDTTPHTTAQKRKKILCSLFGIRNCRRSTMNKKDHQKAFLERSSPQFSHSSSLHHTTPHHTPGC